MMRAFVFTLLFILLAPAWAAPSYVDSVYQLKTLDDLAWLSGQAAAGATSGKAYKLMNDINASATSTWNDSGTDTSVLEGFKPIGDGLVYFNGSFDGAGHKITGLYINRTNPIITNKVGLFGCIGTTGTVRNLGVAGVSITGGNHVGGLAGVNNGTVTGCHSTGTVRATGTSGGLVGYHRGSITGCYSSADVTSTGPLSSSGSWVGGLVGLSEKTGVVSGSHASGAVTGNDCIGGLLGNGQGPVSDCYATGPVKGTHYVGGLVGRNRGTVTASHATGSAMGSVSIVGGLVGWHYTGVVTNCYSSGTASGIGLVGGLVGLSDAGTTITTSCATGSVIALSSAGGLIGSFRGSVLSNCYSTGAIRADEFCGGLVGNCSASIKLANCYSTGAITTATTMAYGAGVGGLVGANGTAASSSYWNVETSGQNTSGGGTGLSSLQMRKQSAFAGWDFTNTWGMQGAYPYLRAIPTQPLNYVAGPHGMVGDGLTTASTLTQVVNISSSGVGVKAVPDRFYAFMNWSDSQSNPQRTDIGVTGNMAFVALFKDTRNVAHAWGVYR